MKSLALAFSMMGSCLSIMIQENHDQACSEESFQPRCSYSQRILITQARYGHLEVSRCVAADFGHLGCFADVMHIVGTRCNDKSRCQINIPDGEISSTKPCLPGLAMYLDVYYVCIPETLATIDCIKIDVNQRLQYITSRQIEDMDCHQRNTDGQNIVAFSAQENLNIRFTITKLSASDQQGFDGNTTIASIMDGTKTDVIHMEGDKTTSEFVTQSSNIELSLHNTEIVLLIAFQAFGCQDPTVPAYTWMTRKGDKATVGCENNDYTWQLSCHGSKWIGSFGNCTNVPKEVVLTKAVEKAEKNSKLSPSSKKKETLSKEILFALIIGITLFLCVVVVTTGYVYLKRARYSSRATNKNSIEMAGIVCDGEDTNSWSRKTFLRNGQQQAVNLQQNQWQQSLAKAQIIQSNGTLPGNTQKYYILDRDE